MTGPPTSTRATAPTSPSQPLAWEGLPVKGVAFDSADVFAWCRQRLETSFVPSYLQVVYEIPKTASEKPQERFLLEAFQPQVEVVEHAVADRRARIAHALEFGGAEFAAGRGCAHCHYTGYEGRVGVFELLVLNEDVKNALLAANVSLPAGALVGRAVDAAAGRATTDAPGTVPPLVSFTTPVRPEAAIDSARSRASSIVKTPFAER